VIRTASKPTPAKNPRKKVIEAMIIAVRFAIAGVFLCFSYS